MTEYQEGDRIRVTYPSGTVVEGGINWINWIRDDGTTIDIREIGDYIREGTPEFDSIELIERPTPPQGTMIRAVLNSEEVRVGIIDKGRFIGYYSSPGGVAIPLNYELSEFSSWEVIK